MYGFDLVYRRGPCSIALVSVPDLSTVKLSKEIEIGGFDRVIELLLNNTAVHPLQSKIKEIIGPGLVFLK